MVYTNYSKRLANRQLSRQTSSSLPVSLAYSLKEITIVKGEKSTLCILHKNVLHQRVKGTGIADQFVKEADNVSKFWPVISLLLPAMEHQLVQRCRTAHGSRKSVTFFNGQNDLNANIHRLFSYILGQLIHMLSYNSFLSRKQKQKYWYE